MMNCHSVLDTESSDLKMLDSDLHRHDGVNKKFLN
jgi:hypothetical protein